MLVNLLPPHGVHSSMNAWPATRSTCTWCWLRTCCNLLYSAEPRDLISSTRERYRFQEARGDAYYFYETINTIVMRIVVEDYKHTYLPIYPPIDSRIMKKQKRCTHGRMHTLISHTIDTHTIDSTLRHRNHTQCTGDTYNHTLLTQRNPIPDHRQIRIRR